MPAVQSMLVALADAVAGVLNAALSAHPENFAVIGWTAVRKFNPIIDLSKANILSNSAPPLVFVRPLDDGAKRLGGGANPQFHGLYRVQLCIYSRVGAGVAAEANCQTLMDLRQQMRDLLTPALLTVTGVRTAKVTLDEFEEVPIFGEATLVNEEVFASGTMLKWAMPGR